MGEHLGEMRHEGGTVGSPVLTWALTASGGSSIPTPKVATFPSGDFLVKPYLTELNIQLSFWHEYRFIH